MPAQIFKTFQGASFNGKRFPVSSVRIIGGIRRHVHEYPHSPNGNLEKLGRRPYEIHMTAPFHASLPKYPTLYPRDLDTLVGFFEQETTGDLVIPTVGTIRACALDWDRLAKSTTLSGEDVQIVFGEDQNQLFLTNELVDSTTTSLATKSNAALELAAIQKFQSPKTLGLLDAFQMTVSALTSIADTEEMVSNLASIRLAQVMSAASDLDRCAEMQDPRHAAFINSLRDVWYAAQVQSQNLQKNVAPPQKYIVPVTCAIAQISTAIYGNTDHQIELMQVNPIDDPFAVPAGTILTYIPQAA